MKKLLALAVALLMLFPAAAAGAAPVRALPNSDPIAKGTVNKVSTIYWGKSEMYPVLGTAWPGDDYDIYEYDKTWVMVLYDSYVKQGYSGTAQSFYGYMKRADITCDPPLEGDESAKADTGPGKRKGKKPNPKPSSAASADATAPGDTAPQGSAEPEPTVETVDDEEYDWIIRTPGTCSVTVKYSVTQVTCSFALMAQKAGGTGASSDPAFNHGMRTPYAATAFYSMVSTMQDLLEGMGATSYLEGSGGVELTGQAAGTKFYIDTGSQDPALVNFTLNMDGVGTLNPKITGENVSGSVETTIKQKMAIPVQLVKSGSGYKFVLKGLKPGGGDLEFPAVLEKAFADPDRWDKEAKDADRRRKEAEDLRKKLLEKIKKQTQDEYKRNQENQGDGETQTTAPMTVPGEDGSDVPLAPLVTEEPPLAPLVTEEPPLAPLVTDEPLAPLVPQQGEEVDGFPPRK